MVGGRRLRLRLRRRRRRRRRRKLRRRRRRRLRLRLRLRVWAVAVPRDARLQARLPFRRAERCIPTRVSTRKLARPAPPRVRRRESVGHLVRGQG